MKIKIDKTYLKIIWYVICILIGMFLIPALLTAESNVAVMLGILGIVSISYFIITKLINYIGDNNDKIT